jgi:hypothetical protein
MLPVLLLSLIPPRDQPEMQARTAVAIPSPIPGVFQEGEELTYEVRWTMFKIGTVRIRISPGHRAQAWIDSYENLPFVDLHAVYASDMDAEFFSKGSWAIDLSEGEWGGTNYRCDSTSTRVFVEDVAYRDLDSPPYRRHVRDTLELGSPRFVDGLAIAYLPRILAHTSQQAEIQTILNGRLGTTTFYCDEERTEEDIDACEYPVRVIRMNGKTNVVGVFGMTGDFTGWFSDDAAAVPIKGKLNVLLGNVTIELIRWDRKGWSPPAAGR